jgi:sterol desaturase/sphingolipid hydroxylase (fatty acid hydroxylase superfamily)
MSEITVRLSFFIGIFVIMALWETIAPARSWKVGRWQHWLHNLSLTLLNTALLRLLIPIAAVGTALLAAENGWGLFNLWQLPFWLQFIASLLILDLAIYFQHRLFHVVPMFWRLHRVHHADLDYDFTTGARFHPIEILLSMLIKMLLVLTLGVDALAVIAFEIILSTTATFNHGNVRLPSKLEPLVRLLLVTPEMHRIHHSTVRKECDSNYGFSLSLWDRLFASYTKKAELGDEGVEIGLKQYRDKEQSNKLWSMLQMPFWKL